LASPDIKGDQKLEFLQCDNKAKSLFKKMDNYKSAPMKVGSTNNYSKRANF
jgi:hypothetical protein